MTTHQLIQLSDRITRMHSGVDLRTVMSNPERHPERGMLHMVLDSLDHCEPSGYLAVARALAAQGYKCHGSVYSAWSFGLHKYATCGTFKFTYHNIVDKLRNERAAR